MTNFGFQSNISNKSCMAISSSKFHTITAIKAQNACMPVYLKLALETYRYINYFCNQPNNTHGVDNTDTPKLTKHLCIPKNEVT